MQRFYRRVIRGWIIGMCVCLLPVPGFTETVSNLYQQRELVVSQSLDERRQAAAKALATVVVRVTGQPQALRVAEVQSAMAAPDRYVEAFRYESGNATIERDGEWLPATTLVLNFSPVSVEKLLRDAGLPLWPANRPAVLLWLVTDSLDSGRQMVALQDNPLAETVQSAAVQRGLPLVLPQLDVEDQAALTPEDLWKLEQAVIEEASARYGAGAILVGRYSQTSSGRWVSTWLLLHKQERQMFDADGASDAEVVQYAVNTTSDYLAGIYAINTRGGTVDAVVMDIEQVDAFEDYAKALAYLQALAIVRELNVVAIEGSRVRVLLRTEGELSQLQNTLELDHRLSQLPAATGDAVGLPAELAPAGSEQNPLRVRWNG